MMHLGKVPLTKGKTTETSQIHKLTEQMLFTPSEMRDIQKYNLKLDCVEAA